MPSSWSSALSHAASLPAVWTNLQVSKVPRRGRSCRQWDGGRETLAPAPARGRAATVRGRVALARPARWGGGASCWVVESAPKPQGS